eukprot:822952-Prymnesium_polylepis.1
MASEGLGATYRYVLYVLMSPVRGRDAAARPPSCRRPCTIIVSKPPTKSSGRPSCSPSTCIRSCAAKPVAGGKPVSIVQNSSSDLLDGGATAERSRTTSPVTPATGPAVSTTTSN